MDYVSLNQGDTNTDLNMLNSNSDTVGILEENYIHKHSLKVAQLKNQICRKAKKSKKQFAKLRKTMYHKCIENQNRASMIVHMVTNSPKDPKNMIYLSLLLSSIGYLFPFNCMINATDYYKEKYCNNEIVYSITEAYIFVAVSTVVFHNFFVRFVHFSKRIIFGYLIAITFLSLLTLFVIWLKLLSDHAAYNYIIVTAGFTAFGCAIQQSSYYGYASLLPRRYTHALMIGESLSGVLASLLRISIVGLNLSSNNSATIYFILSLLILFACLITFQMSLRSNFVQHHLQRHQFTYQNQAACSHTNAATFTIPVSNVNGFIDPQFDVAMTSSNHSLPEPISSHVHQDEPPHVESSSDDNGEAELDDFYPEFESSEFDPSDSSMSHLYQASRSSSRNSVGIEGQTRNDSIGTRFARWIQTSGLYDSLRLRIQIIRHIWPYLLTILLAYFVTLSVFPGVIIDIRGNKWIQIFPLLMLISFNIFELFGKIIASCSCRWHRLCLLALSVARVSLTCLILYVVIVSIRNSPVILGRDVLAFSLIALLGLTNGYVGCVPMLEAPQSVREGDREIAGNLMTTSLNIGLCLGVVLSLRFEQHIYSMLHPQAALQLDFQYPVWSNGSVFCVQQ